MGTLQRIGLFGQGCKRAANRIGQQRAAVRGSAREPARRFQIPASRPRKTLIYLGVFLVSRLVCAASATTALVQQPRRTDERDLPQRQRSRTGRGSSLCYQSSGHPAPTAACCPSRSEEHTSELQSRVDLVCRLLLEKKKKL